MTNRLGAKYGPVCLVLWEGAARAASYPDYPSNRSIEIKANCECPPNHRERKKDEGNSAYHSEVMIIISQGGKEQKNDSNNASSD